jgi:cell division protein FtsZ
MRLAEAGIAELQQYVDTLIIIPNQNLFRIANEKTTFADAFKMADDVLHSGVRGVTDLMVMPGLINLDFADIRSVMTEMGKAMMGTGEASGERRSIQASEAAISNPLLDDVSMKGARGVLINITGGYDMTLFEVDEAANRIRDEVDPDANIIFGSTFDPSMEGLMRVSVVATGIDAASMAVSRHQAAPASASAPAPAPAPAAVNVAPAFGVGGRRSGGTSSGGAPSARTIDYHSTLVAAPMAPGHQSVAASAAQNPAVTAALINQPVTNTATAHAYDLDEEPELAEPAPAHPQAAANAAAAVRAALGAEPIQTRPSGPLRGERRDGAFIAPRPVDAGPRQPAAAPEAPIADDRPRKRSLSLFERVTGLGWRGREEAEAEAASAAARAAQPQPSAQAPRLQPSLQANNTPKVPPAQRHGEATERGKQARAEEDVLDIPAFLRRQAN